MIQRESERDIDTNRHRRVVSIPPDLGTADTCWVPALASSIMSSKKPFSFRISYVGCTFSGSRYIGSGGAPDTALYLVVVVSTN